MNNDDGKMKVWRFKKDDENTKDDALRPQEPAKSVREPSKIEIKYEIKRKKSSPIFTYALIVLLLGGCFTSVSFGLIIKVKQSAITGWPSVTGKVTKNTIITKGTSRYSGNPMFFIPEILYEYEVKGSTYSSDTVKYSFLPPKRWYSGKDLAEERVKAYPLDGEVTVYYNPRDPAEAVLETDGSNLWIGILIFGGFLGALGLVFLKFSKPKSK